MQSIHSFGISPREYSKRGLANDFPELEACPACAYPGPMLRHGYYWRNALFLRRSFRIPICRYKCRSCHITVSFLPDFLLPYYQYALVFILDTLRNHYIHFKRRPYYQLVQFYRKRYTRNLNRIEAFFRDYQVWVEILAKEKAIKLLEIIRTAFPKAPTFAKRYHEHFLHNFMAH